MCRHDDTRKGASFFRRSAWAAEYRKNPHTDFGGRSTKSHWFRSAMSGHCPSALARNQEFSSPTTTLRSIPSLRAPQGSRSPSVLFGCQHPGLNVGTSAEKACGIRAACNRVRGSGAHLLISVVHDFFRSPRDLESGDDSQGLTTGGGRIPISFPKIRFGCQLLAPFQSLIRKGSLPVQGRQEAFMVSRSRVCAIALSVSFRETSAV